VSMHIGIICYPTQGGSGIVATELGLELAKIGHQVHFISYRKPFRLDRMYPDVHFHQVEVSSYPLFEYPPYSLALTSKILEIHKRERLDLIHAHYAIPHTISAWMASRMLEDDRLPLITTLHGTDITLVGQDPGYLPVTQFTLKQSDAITSVSDWLKEETLRVFGQDLNVTRIHNFVDTDEFKPLCLADLRSCYANPDEKLLLHVSNFRPVKRVQDVIQTFASVQQSLPARLILAGLGPERNAMKELARELGLESRVHFIGNNENIIDLMNVADVFLLPSESESFGLAALEAMSCGVPVIASRVGGLPELIDSGLNSYLCEKGDTRAMAQAAIELLSDARHYDTIARAARDSACDRFAIDKILPLYVKLYEASIRA
jgi:N-acetyl-alpha-D-glucosaminyl L-malate synthase BshA